MELSSEQTVTNILSENSIIHRKNSNYFTTNPTYNLGKFLSDNSSEQSVYGNKYIFIR